MMFKRLKGGFILIFCILIACQTAPSPPTLTPTEALSLTATPSEVNPTPTKTEIIPSPTPPNKFDEDRYGYPTLSKPFKISIMLDQVKDYLKDGVNQPVSVNVFA